jgi:hypothetical protein
VVRGERDRIAGRYGLGEEGEWGVVIEGVEGLLNRIGMEDEGNGRWKRMGKMG